ncbi:MAG: transcription regulator of the Arc/MetJ class [Candidatus Scalindua rubra]|uniref:Transcription regulator of the Arc/MetJ class n=1 Tax=Candidatus Scalindua rubra TaxID=1872076 RepID=A0A1E3XG79_9BACT|nr:MAG: transcription regulator of the Arc/MetJ class [Candidatus Scalindua rubra]
MGKTTVFLDDDLIKEALKATNLKTKREVIEEGLKELIRKRSQERLRQELGTYDIDLTLKELERLRSKS